MNPTSAQLNAVLVRSSPTAKCLPPARLQRLDCKRLTCRTDFKAREAVAITAAEKPVKLKDGSPPVAMTIPTTTGISAPYVRAVSRQFSNRRLKAAVKAGVVAPMACKYACHYIQSPFDTKNQRFIYVYMLLARQ